jgi:hypothetical protein
MRMLSTSVIVAALLLSTPMALRAQTVDDIIEKSVAALGGRAAHEKLKSRFTGGTITLTTPAGDIKGTVEVWNTPPNKNRTVIKADLSQLGAGELVVDQRFNGTVGYIMDSLQGDREMEGNQLANQKNAFFPHPFLAYKESGGKAQLAGKEKVGARETYVVVFEPKEGSVVRSFIDAQTFLPVQSVMTVAVPQLGSDVEQTLVFSDYREVDGVKLPFKLQMLSAVQSFTVVIDKLEHNVKVDEALFSKPAK